MRNARPRLPDANCLSTYNGANVISSIICMHDEGPASEVRIRFDQLANLNQISINLTACIQMECIQYVFVSYPYAMPEPAAVAMAIEATAFRKETLNQAWLVNF